MSNHTDHEVSVQPDIDNLEFRPWCHDCETFVEWERSGLER